MDRMNRDKVYNDIPFSNADSADCNPASLNKFDNTPVMESRDYFQESFPAFGRRVVSHNMQEVQSDCVTPSGAQLSSITSRGFETDVTVLSGIKPQFSLPVAQLQLSNAAVAQPQCSTPAVAQPWFLNAPVAQPQFSTPSVAQPQFSTPPVAQPQFSTPPVALSQFSTPPVALSQFSTLPVAQPQFSIPPVAQPQFSTPPVAQPQFSNTPVAQPQFSNTPVAPLMLPPPSHCFPPRIDLSVPPPMFPLAPPSLPPARVSDEEKQVQFLIGKLNSKLVSPTVKKKNSINISELRKMLRCFSMEIKDLESLYNRLSILHKSLDQEDWLQRLKEAESIKCKVFESMTQLKNIPLNEVVLILKKRKSKRKRLKRKKEEWKLSRQESIKERKAIDAKINIWMDHMTQIAETSKREEEVKREADLVLLNVRHKKSEGKNMLSLLTTLGKLRNARIKNRETRGEFVSKEAAETFNFIIDKLKKMWLEQMREYKIEEEGLKVMLEEAADSSQIKADIVNQSMSKQIVEQWSNALFGHSKDAKAGLPQDIEEFISVRKSWDVYTSEAEGSSAIPIGWIVPVQPSSDEWKKYLANKN